MALIRVNKSTTSDFEWCGGCSSQSGIFYGNSEGTITDTADTGNSVTGKRIRMTRSGANSVVTATAPCHVQGCVHPNGGSGYTINQDYSANDTIVTGDNFYNLLITPV